MLTALFSPVGIPFSLGERARTWHGYAMKSVQVDHLVYGVADLDSAARDLAAKLGVEPVAGGRHVNRGTHNALLGLGGGSYLEVIAADPGQAPFAGELPFGLDRADLPRLVGWAVRVPDID